MSRQTEIDDHQIGLAGGRFDQALLAGFRIVNNDALAFQGGSHEAPDLLFVFDQYNGNAGVTHGFESSSGVSGASGTGEASRPAR